jgi:hypothetical protein
MNTTKTAHDVIAAAHFELCENEQIVDSVTSALLRERVAAWFAEAAELDRMMCEMSEAKLQPIQ